MFKSIHSINQTSNRHVNIICVIILHRWALWGFLLLLFPYSTPEEHFRTVMSATMGIHKIVLSWHCFIQLSNILLRGMFCYICLKIPFINMGTDYRKISTPWSSSFNVIWAKTHFGSSPVYIKVVAVPLCLLPVHYNDVTMTMMVFQITRYRRSLLQNSPWL